MNHDKLKCSICSELIQIRTYELDQVWSKGHNAWPVTDGRCCDDCNAKHVIPKRMELSTHKPTEVVT